MSRTGGGPGSNQYGPRGFAERKEPAASEPEVALVPRPGRDLFDPINQPYGAIPVEEEVREQLLPQHRDIQTMAELNALEQANINRGLLWVRSEGLDADDLLNQNVLNEVHGQMFGEVWEWAGQIRTRGMSIGIDPHQIREQGKAALDDAKYHCDARTMTPGEVVLRLHHRTVQIHPYVNGNGRHARLMAEELATALGMDDGDLTWGRHLDTGADSTRREYLRVLRALDLRRNDIEGLIAFALDPTAENEWQ